MMGMNYLPSLRTYSSALDVGQLVKSLLIYPNATLDVGYNPQRIGNGNIKIKKMVKDAETRPGSHGLSGRQVTNHYEERVKVAKG